jgi:hypothetical protein
MRVVSSLRMERDHKAIVVFQKVKVRITTYYLLKSPRSDGLRPVVIEKPYNRLQICLLQLFIYLKVTSMFLYLDPVPSFLELRL